MKSTFKDKLASNLISVIIIFLLLTFFDASGDKVRNILLVIVGFSILSFYDYWRIKSQEKE
ncbi:sec-independent periplasmic protein translocation protein TatC [Streptococcus saliviloxodontae]|uniref:Sec-independent periplasmic protein translocation protein TatC n=1 Tax=Streptococcus saliviloxodontae TaxID=1349416 RepID=A0ABS2PME9_9STRE|nr:hypothetical protein [Streptococcus saliviloxodontae]